MQGAAAGRWYEVGKIQTAGGAFFERTCVCTNLVWSVDENGADGQVSNICRNKVPSGKLEIFNASLKGDPQNPGHFAETGGYGPPASYNIVYQTGDAAVEYDCVESLGVTNYCIHLLSRNRTMPDSVVQMLLQLTNVTLGLNYLNLPYHKTMQTGCPDPQ